ncbi:MAG: hypothetical protein ACK5JO_16675, partial [Halodesulfovibrio sp.]
ALQKPEVFGQPLNNVQNNGQNDVQNAVQNATQNEPQNTMTTPPKQIEEAQKAAAGAQKPEEAKAAQ